MSTTFTQFNLHQRLIEGVDARNYVKPTPIQEALIPVMLEGRDVVGQAQTGTGKTAAFALPTVNKIVANQQGDQRGEIQALVLAPTRELAKQVAEAIYAYSNDMGLRVLPIYGGQPYGRQIRRINKGVDIAVATPGRLLDLIRKNSIDLSHVQTVVLDEADEMLSMGFIDDIESIIDVTPATRQTAFFSATLPKSVEKLANRHMNNQHSVSMGHERPLEETIEQRYYIVNRRNRLSALLDLLEIEPVESAIVFARTRAETFELANALNSRGHQAGALNGEMSQPARQTMLDRFRNGEIKILVGTNVAARGLDIDHITHVFNTNIPRDPQVYVHRIGRTGRAGKSGTAISLISSNKRGLLRKVERYMKKDIPRADLPSIDDMQAHRDAKFTRKLSEALEKGISDRDRKMAASLIDEGHDAVDVVAAAIKAARGEESAAARSTHGQSKGTRTDRESRSHENGMVRLSIDAGTAIGTRPGHVVGSIAGIADIPGSIIGKIRIQNNRTLVDVPANVVDKVLSRNGSYHINDKRVQLQRA